MNLVAYTMGLSALAGMNRYAGMAQQSNEARMGLANPVGFGAGNISTIAQQDKALQLASAHASVMYEASQALAESAERLREKDREMRQRLEKAGATFI